MQGTCVNIELSIIVYTSNVNIMACNLQSAWTSTFFVQTQLLRAYIANCPRYQGHREAAKNSLEYRSMEKENEVLIYCDTQFDSYSLTQFKLFHSSSDRINFVLGWHFLSSSHTLSRIVFLWGLLLLKTHAMLNNPYTHNRARIMRIILRVIVMVSGFFQETGGEHGHCSYNSWWHLDHPRHSASPGTLTLVCCEIIQRVWRDLSLENYIEWNSSNMSFKMHYPISHVSWALHYWGDKIVCWEVFSWSPRRR